MGESTFYLNMATIRITDLALSAIIGTNKWERSTKQKIVINIVFSYDSKSAIHTDNLKYATDYKTLTKKIIAGVKASRFYLLETLANFILTIVMENSRISFATVRVDKPKALRFARSVSAEVSAKRS